MFCDAKPPSAVENKPNDVLSVSLQASPKERYEAMKRKVDSLREKRKDRALKDADVTTLVSDVRGALGEDDLKLVNTATVTALTKEPKGEEGWGGELRREGASPRSRKEGRGRSPEVEGAWLLKCRGR